MTTPALLDHDCVPPRRKARERRPGELWTCPACLQQWKWGETGTDRRGFTHVGWLRSGTAVAKEIDPAPKCSNPRCPQCTGQWDLDEEKEPKHVPWWWPLPPAWFPHRW